MPTTDEKENIDIAVWTWTVNCCQLAAADIYKQIKNQFTVH